MLLPAEFVAISSEDCFNNLYFQVTNLENIRQIGTIVEKKDATLQTWRRNLGGFWNVESPGVLGYPVSNQKA